MIERAKHRFVDIDEDKKGVATARAAMKSMFGDAYCVIPTSLVTNALAIVGMGHMMLTEGRLNDEKTEVLFTFVGKVLKSAAEGAGIELDELAVICSEICKND